jgi:ferredoxin-NADP reductase
MDNQNIPANSQPSDPKNIKTFEIALRSKRQIAKDTWAFVFEKPAGFHFKAGQHIKMTLINFSGTNNEDHSRFFSVASTPAEANLTIAMRMGETVFKQILDRMPVGGKVKIEMLLDNIHPSFTLPNNPANPAVFIIGGIGIVPAFSVIKDAFERKLSHEIFLFYSNRRPKMLHF